MSDGRGSDEESPGTEQDKLETTERGLIEQDS